MQPLVTVTNLTVRASFLSRTGYLNEKQKQVLKDRQTPGTTEQPGTRSPFQTERGNKRTVDHLYAIVNIERTTRQW